MHLYEVPAFEEKPTGISTASLFFDAKCQQKPLDKTVRDAFGGSALVYEAPYAFCLSSVDSIVGERITGEDVHGVARFMGTLTLRTVLAAQDVRHTFGVVEESDEAVLVLRNFAGLDSDRVGIIPPCELPTVSSTSTYIGLPVRDDVFLQIPKFYKLADASELPDFSNQLRIV